MHIFVSVPVGLKLIGDSLMTGESMGESTEVKELRLGVDSHGFVEMLSGVLILLRVSRFMCSVLSKTMLGVFAKPAVLSLIHFLCGLLSLLHGPLSKC